MTAERASSALRDDGAGGLSYRGSRYLLVRPETLVALQKAVEAALGERAAACLVAGGRAGGGSALRSVEGSAEEIVERLAERVLGAPAAATETACVATGASLCRFAARVR